MKHKFTCSNCKTAFSVDIPDDTPAVLCPACGRPIKVIVDEVGTLEDNIKQMALREGNWILWAAGAFALIWGLVVLAMVLMNRHNAAVTGTPPPPPAPIVTPRVTPPPAPAPSVPASVPAPAPAPVAVTPPPPAPKPPAKVPIVKHYPALTDPDIVKAIQKGVDFLLSNFTTGEINPTISNNVSDVHGIDALAVYAILHCGHSMRDDRISITTPAIRQMVEHLKRLNFAVTGNSNDPITYSRSLRASALAIYNRPEDRDVLAGDLAWLLRAQEDGAFGYDDIYMRKSMRGKKAPTPPPGAHDYGDFRWDNSNSQYGLIGVWNCAEAGLSVPNKFWQDVEQHWISSQTPLGTWDYQTGGGTNYAMTMAGITALSVCRDYMNDPATQPTTPGAPTVVARSESLEKAMRWFESGDNSVNVNGMSYGYSLYGLERAALASGMLYAGTHDIYGELAAKLVKEQLKNGAWRSENGRDAVIETSFSLLFLARGRNPVMVNKLRYDGNWDNRQRDMANLTRYAGYAMERPLNWQVATLTQPWGAWMEAPILYISGDADPGFGPADIDRLKNYVDNGGLIFTHADNGSDAFNKFANDLATKLFPKYEMTPVKENDDLFSLVFKVPYPHPRLRAVSNGSRKLMIHCTDDLAGQWQENNPKRTPMSFTLGLNIFVYATGKADLRAKTNSPFINLTDASSPIKYIPIARIEYAGNWNPEPAAWDRFTRYFWQETGWTLQPDHVLAADLRFKDYPIAHLTGTAAQQPTQAEIKSLARYVREGGTLIIDSCGGSRDFAESVKKLWLPAIAPDGSLHVLAADDPVLTGQIEDAEEGASDVTHPQLRPYAQQITKPPNIHLMDIKSGRGRIFFTEIDITSGLLGTNTWGITGFTPNYAQDLTKNVILEATTRPDQP